MVDILSERVDLFQVNCERNCLEENQADFIAYLLTI